MTCTCMRARCECQCRGRTLANDPPRIDPDAGCGSSDKIRVVGREFDRGEAKERYPVGSDDWAEAAAVFNMLIQKACDEVAEPEWWNGAQGAVDEGCE